MMPPYSCRRAGQEARHVDERDDRDVERVAEAARSGRPSRDASMSRQPAQMRGWLATMPTVRPPKRAKPTTMFLP
jgi:hypothetical protein